MQQVASAFDYPEENGRRLIRRNVRQAVISDASGAQRGGVVGYAQTRGLRRAPIRILSKVHKKTGS
jgi:hypothetical protein